MNGTCKWLLIADTTISPDKSHLLQCQLTVPQDGKLLTLHRYIYNSWEISKSVTGLVSYLFASFSETKQKLSMNFLKDTFWGITGYNRTCYNSVDTPNTWEHNQAKLHKEFFLFALLQAQLQRFLLEPGWSVGTKWLLHIQVGSRSHVRKHCLLPKIIPVVPADCKTTTYIIWGIKLRAQV